MIFKNQKRENNTQPEYRGKINIAGEIHDVALWVNTSASSGKKYMSGIHTPEKKQQTVDGIPYKTVGNTPEEAEKINNEDLPF